MSTTESSSPMAELYAALARAIASAGAVEKDAKNTHQGYKYASAESLIEEARGHLAAQGLACVPKRIRTVPLAGGAVSAGGKANWYFADVEVTYHVTHAAGGVEICETSTPAIVDNGRPQDKAVATAQTYSLGYFLRTLLMLPRVDADTDVDRRDDRADPRDERPRPTAQPRQPPPPAPPAIDWAKEADALATAMDMAQTVDELRALVPRLNAFPPDQRGERWRALREKYNVRKAAIESDEAMAARDAERAS